MFRLIYILVIALSGCFASSSAINENALNTTPLAKTQDSLVPSNNGLASVVTMRVEQTISYNNLKIRVGNIEDSRCPTGTTCIWAGQMVVTLEVLNELQKKKEIKLVRKREPETATAFGFNFLLLAVEPHPKKGKVIQLSDQTIKFQIVRAMQNMN